jgi:ABC-type antimicrobial peptide transport system permease subunit
MNLFHQILAAFISLRRNVLRSLLTMLGIVIGVGVVITMMEIGAGAAQSIKSSISNMGTNVMTIWPSAVKTSGISSGAGGSVTLTEADCAAIVAECLSVEAASPTLSRRGIQAIAGNRNWTPFTVYSGNEDYFTVQSWKTPEAGRYFTKREVDTASCVCVIGQTVKDELFPDENAVGRDLRLNSVLFRVIGVLPKKGANMMGMDQDDVVIVPWRTMRNRLSRSGSSATGAGGATSSTTSTTSTTSSVYPENTTTIYPARDSVQAKNYPLPVRFNNIDQIVCSAKSPEQVPDAMRQITEVLRRRHKIAPGMMNDFQIRDMAEMLKTMTSTSGLMTTLLLIVALLSLVVGGVGIMNIMLVSVTERTREIGLRMAVGARGSRILTQFLIESVLLCLMGGIVGIGVGRCASIVIANVLHWPVCVSLSAIVLSAGISAAIGVVFGFYPAWRASRLNPIDALRHE